MKLTKFTPFLGIVPSMIALKYSKKKSIIYIIGTITSILNHLTKNNKNIKNIHKFLKYLHRFIMWIFFIFFFNNNILLKIILGILYFYSKILNEYNRDKLHACVHIISVILIFLDLKN